MEVEMTFERYISDYKGMKPLEFTMLDEVQKVLTYRTQRLFRVVALATSPRKAIEPCFFALALERNLGEVRLAVLTRYIDEHGSIKESWFEDRKIFFHPWVKRWLVNHPEQLVRAGMIIGRDL